MGFFSSYQTVDDGRELSFWQPFLVRDFSLFKCFYYKRVESPVFSLAA